MASSILGIDLDAAELRVAELAPGGGGYTLIAAFTLPTGAADAAALGAQLKERLKEVGIKATTAVVALGHDVLTCRLVRHPDIPEGELPAIVQFQVLKESSLPADESVVDYVPLRQLLATGERRSLTYVARKGRVQFCEHLCEGAGLRLLAVVPRAVALAAALTKGRTDAPGTAAFAASNTFFVLSEGELVFNRSLATPHDAADFFGELRQSLAGYENQPNLPSAGGLFIATTSLPPGGEALLAQSRVQAQLYDPYMGVQGTERLARQGDFAVAVGAAQVAKAYRKPPVDFLSPKKVVVKPDNRRKYAISAAAAAGLFALVVGGGYWWIASSYDGEITELQGQVNQEKEQEKTFFADVDKKFEFIDAWNKQEVLVLDELYDLVAAFPDVAGVQIMKAEWKSLAPAVGAPAKAVTPPPGKTPATPVPARTNASAKPVARLTVRATAEQEPLLRELESALRSGKHWKFVKSEIVTQEKNTRTYELDILPLKPAEYAALISQGSNVTATGDGQPTTTRRRPGFRPAGGRP